MPNADDSFVTKIVVIGDVIVDLKEIEHRGYLTFIC